MQKEAEEKKIVEKQLGQEEYSDQVSISKPFAK